MLKLLLSLPLFFVFLSGSESDFLWESSPSDVRKQSLDSEFLKIDLNQDAVSSNKILSHINSIHPDIISSAAIYRSGNSDYVFIKDKLICVCSTEYQISPELADKKISGIRKLYMNESLVNENGITTYNLYGETTIVNLSVRDSGSLKDIRIYYYPKNLFSILVKI
ncbi:MAG: hypothetical protein KA015_00070 [Spirochaetes bacterium]|nr:hypothetical protein [Spirochaetota bacterium]